MAEPIFPYPAPRVSNRSGTINVQFGSYSTNFGQLGTSVGNQQYTGRAFVNTFFDLPLGIYNFNLKEVKITLPQGYPSQQLIGGSTYTLPTPTFLLEGAIFDRPNNLYDQNGFVEGGLIIPAETNGIYHHASTGNDSMVQLATTTVTPEWKCQYYNLNSQFVPLNLRIINRDPTVNLTLANNPNYWFDEPIPIGASTNPTWPWFCTNVEGVVSVYPPNSTRNLINVILTIEYNRINALPTNGV
jgi:hypothetical protein